jgi:2,4-dienoyl-CoA reductase (NADPH2)
MSLEDIARTKQAYADAALRAKQSGFDMVELLASAGYLICQFLSPRINQRSDEYGGGLENRMRFGLEVVRTVREAVGPAFCLGVRVAGNDFVPGSHTNRETTQFAAACVQAGADLINVTGGWHETKVPQLTGELPGAGFSYLARGVKHAVPAPVALSNRINLPDAAEEVLARGDADLICLARPLIADPDWPLKAASGRPELIRPCIACNQGCFDSLFQGGAVGCSVNPGAGLEYLPENAPASPKRRILVVGGGPAGCSAALSATRRGHEVSLWEAGPRLGGQPQWYGVPLGKPDFALLGPHFEAALDEAGVNVSLNRRADALTVQQFAPDRVILATGARPAPPAIPGADLDHVCSAWQILQKERRALKNVLVVGGGAVGVETAIHLARSGALSPEQVHFMTLFGSETPETINDLIAKSGRSITLVEMLPKLGRDIGRSTRWIAFMLLKRYGIQTMTNTRVLAIEPGQVLLQSRGEPKSIKADSVVMAAGARPENSLHPELIKYNIEVERVGDAMAVADLGAAIHSGHDLGGEI